MRCDTEGMRPALIASLEAREWFKRQGAIVQELVPPVGHDLRVIVAGGIVVGAEMRVAAPGDWRTNISLGGLHAPHRRVRLPAPLRSRVAAVRAVGGDFFGVDLLPYGLRLHRDRGERRRRLRLRLLPARQRRLRRHRRRARPAGRRSRAPRVSCPPATKEDLMCRWLAYSGSPVLIEDLLFKSAHSLVDQSLHSRLGVETTNGDGFGIGWYGTGDGPGLYHCIEPAWNERNLRELAAHVESPLVFAHIRASSGTPVQETQLPPVPLRELALDAQRSHPRLRARSSASSCSPSIRRSTPPSRARPTPRRSSSSRSPSGSSTTRRLAVARAIGLVEAVGDAHGVEHPMQGTLATTNGKQTWVFRYSSEHNSRSLFFSTKIETLRHLYPDNPVFANLDAASRLVVSEPLGDLPGAWNELPESSYGVVGRRRGLPPPVHPREPPRRPRTQCGETSQPRPLTRAYETRSKPTYEGVASQDTTHVDPLSSDPGGDDLRDLGRST